MLYGSKENLCLSNASQHVSIYLQPFLRYSGISVANDWFSTGLVSEWAFFNHILLSAGYAPGTMAVNVTWTEREFNACQTHRSMYTSIFNRLHAIARYWSEIATFSYPLAFNAPVRSGPWDNCGKCYMDLKRIQCWSNALQHVPIYLQPFSCNSSRKIQSSQF